MGVGTVCAWVGVRWERVHVCIRVCACMSLCESWESECMCVSV